MQTVNGKYPKLAWEHVSVRINKEDLRRFDWIYEILAHWGITVNMKLLIFRAICGLEANARKGSMNSPYKACKCYLS